MTIRNQNGRPGDDRAEESRLSGGSGDDVLRGEGGEDMLNGGPGKDTFYTAGDSAVDVVDCGGGTDTVKKGEGVGLDRFANCERFVR